MQVRELSISHFRGIRSFTWRPQSPLTCIVGAGDSCKSTILDALELVLGARWIAFTDVDFTDCDTTAPITILATVGHLPKEALKENRMGLHLRGWSSSGALRDEPEADDEPVVTVRLTVDATLEPTWELITDRHEPRTLATRDRILFGVVRLGGDADKHLTWGQGSALARLSADKNTAAPLLAEAYRSARSILKSGSLPHLDAVATTVKQAATTLGAYTGQVFSAGLDTQRSNMSLGSLALHNDDIPLRLAGLGTRRLVALAIQQMSIADGCIVLVDELEHGLEPHRIRHALKLLRAAVADPNMAGQVFLTTHAPTAVVELAASQLAVCHRTPQQLAIQTPAPILQALVRRLPEAFLSRRVLVCEGKTEVGLVRGLRTAWEARHNATPLEALGVSIADGNGSQAVATACALADLGFSVALLRDSDVSLSPAQATQIQARAIPLFEWAGQMATEDRILEDASQPSVQAILDVCYSEHGEAQVLNMIRTPLSAPPLQASFLSWNVPGKSDSDYRKAIARAAKQNAWFKRIEPGEQLAHIVAKEIASNPSSPTALTLAKAESWAYA